LDQLASSISVAALCERVGAEFERRLAAEEISTRHASSMRETPKKFDVRFGDTPIKLLQGAEVKGWLASLPLAVKTRNRHLGYVRNILGLAREWNLLEADPFERINGFNDPHAKSRQVAILTPEQVQAFLNAVDPDFLPFFALSAFSGLRREEICRLDWSEIKLDRNLIDLPYTKSKQTDRSAGESKGLALPFSAGIRLGYASKKATARFRKCCQSRRDRPVATERIATLLLFLCRRP
jgi:integrase